MLLSIHRVQGPPKSSSTKTPTARLLDLSSLISKASKSQSQPMKRAAETQLTRESQAEEDQDSVRIISRAISSQ